MGKTASILLPRHGLIFRELTDEKEFAFTHIRTEPPRNALPPWTAFPQRTAVPPSAGSNVIRTKSASVTVLLFASDNDLLSLRLGRLPSMLQNCSVREKTMNAILTKSASVTVLLLASDNDFLSLRLGLLPSMLQNCPVREKTTERCGEDDEEDAKGSVLAPVCGFPLFRE